MRVAVVGHLEWVRFARLEHVPVAGEILHSTEWWELPGGGGPVAAVQLARLAGSCVFFTAVGADALGERAIAELVALGLTVHAAVRDAPTRTAMTFVDANGERTITTLGDRLDPLGADPLLWQRLEEADAVYVTAGDAEAFRRARRARVMVVSLRVLDRLVRSGVEADCLVGSARDPGEAWNPGSLPRAPGLLVRTEGAEGGSFETAEGDRGRYEAEPPPGPIVDTYGAGDSFAAGLTFALGARMGLPEALTFAARCGAVCATGRGPFDARIA